MNDLGIIVEWMVPMVSLLLFVGMIELLCRGFEMLFKMVDTHIQNRGMRNRGYVLMTNDKGQDFWVGYEK